MMIYILEFETPLGNSNHYARYYIGYCADGSLDRRLAEHRAGSGAAMTRAANQRGIAYAVVATMPGDRTKERQLKRQKNTRRIVQKLSGGLG